VVVKPPAERSIINACSYFNSWFEV